MTTALRVSFGVALLSAGCAHKPWSEIHTGFGQATSRDCLSCHEYATPPIQAHRSHPVDVDYAAAASRAASSLRPLADVQQRGIAVPDGKVGCRTCHAAESPWKSHVAIPSGAVARPAVNPRDPRTYESEMAGPQKGAAVSPKPLCEACHVF